MDVAVVGGTGTVGRVVAAGLRHRGHRVRVLSRRPPAEAGAAHYRVDLTTGEGLPEALAGAEVVVDASNPGSPRKDAAAAVLIEGALRLLEAEQQAGVGHHVLVSIVGIEAIPYAYHRFKVRQEAALVESGLSWSVVRATQFHQLLDQLFKATSRWGFLPKAAVPLQPVDPRDVSPVIVAAAEERRSGSRLEIAGPETRTLAELAEMWRRSTRSGARLVPVPLFGDFGRAVGGGALTSATAPRGVVTFAEWLEDRERRPLAA